MRVAAVVVRPGVRKLGARAGAMSLKSLRVIGPFWGDFLVDWDWWVISWRAKAAGLCRRRATPARPGAAAPRAMRAFGWMRADLGSSTGEPSRKMVRILVCRKWVGMVVPIW